MKNILKKHWPFFLLLVLGAALRFYRLPEMASLDFDQEYAANFAYSVVKEFPIQLIGEGLSIQGIFMGPLYFYFLTPFYLLFNLHPLGGAVGSVFIGLLTITVYYFVGNNLFGRPAGLITAFFRAILFRPIQDDFSITPAFSSDLMVILTWFLFYKYWKGENKFLPLLGLVFGFYTSFHPILFPFYFVFLIIFLLRRPWPNLKLIVTSSLAFLLPLTPLILFEYFHKFMEIDTFRAAFLLHQTGIKINLSEKLINLLTIIISDPSQILSLAIPAFLIFFLTILFLVILTLRKAAFGKDRFHFYCLTLATVVFILYYLLLPINILSYYLSAPVVLLLFYLGGILGYLATKPVLKWVIFGFLIYMAFINISLLRGRWSDPSLITLDHKDRIVKAIIERQPSDKDFFVSYINSPGWNFGFDYLFKIYGRIPKKDYVPNYSYTIVIPKSLSPDSINISSGNVGLILPK